LDVVFDVPPKKVDYMLEVVFERVPERILSLFTGVSVGTLLVQSGYNHR
jgi:hypothetical protein